MIQDTIAKIEARIAQTDSVTEESKRELLDLLSALKAEVAELSSTHAEQAESIAGFTGVSTHEAIRQEKNPRLLESAIEGLALSVEEFETSHPKLVENVDAICRMLAAIGV